MTSPKGKTNKKWTSSQDYKSNYDRIFTKVSEDSADKPCDTCGGTGEVDESLGGTGAVGMVPCPDCLAYEAILRDFGARNGKRQED